MTRRRRERHDHRPHQTGGPFHLPDPDHQADSVHRPYLPHQPYLPQFARWAAAIFAVAIAIRLAHVALLRSSPFFDVLLGDARGYDEWARRIAGGEWIGRDVFYQAPLYPYFLGLLYSIAGRDLLVVRIVQAFVGAGACVLVGLAAARLFGSRAGRVAGFGLALYAPAIFFDALLQKSVLDVFFVSLGVWLVARLLTGRTEPTSWLALGLAMGGLSLTRENALVFVVVTLVWIILRSRTTGTPGTRTSGTLGTHPIGTRGTLGTLGTFACGLAIVLVPVAARNYAVGGGFYLTTSQFGPNFYIGNHPGADGTYVSLKPGRGAPEFERQDATELAEQAMKRPLTPREVSSYWTDRALRFITSEPAAWGRLLLRKAALLANTSEMLDTESQESHAEVSWLLRALGPVGHFGVLVPLAALGIWITWSDRRRLWPLTAMLAAYAASVVLLYVFARYRFPLVPLLLTFAAGGVASIADWGRRQKRLSLALGVAALVVFTIAVNVPMLPAARMRAITETNLGAGLHEAGRFEEAVPRYEKAIVIRPDYLPAYNNLGITLRTQGRLDEAIRAYERGLEAGNYPELHFNLANALIASGRAREAESHLKLALAASPGSAGTHNNLGMALAEQGRVEEAAAEFRAAIAAEPASSTAHRNLGNLLATLGRTEDGLRSLSMAVEVDPNDADARYDFGSLLLEQQRFAPAAEQLRAALQLRPDRPEALNNLGIALASQGQLADAVAYFERAVQLRPGFADALKNRDMALKALKR
jgi:tetratricopeptide (TPR) repeat protein